MRFVRLLFFLPALMLQGCWFVFIPGPVIDAAADGLSGSEGRHCVSTFARAGDTIRMADGSAWRVEKTEGTSYRCRLPEHPIRAKLTPV